MIRADLVSDVRAAEAALMALVPDGALMQRAAFGLAVHCAHLLGGAAGRHVVLLVGQGDNGGDTLFAGALLARRGAGVEALLVADGHHAAGAAALREAGGRTTQLSASTARPGADDRARRLVHEADLVLDGIVGIGGSPGLRQPAADLVAAAAERRGLMVAVDLPSGVAVDTGECPVPEHVSADVTVTFGTAKPALLLDPAAAHAGALHRVDIGLEPYLPARPAVEMLEEEDVAVALPPPPRTSHKYSRGVVAVHAGSQPFAGAAVLAVGGALRAGAGLVRYSGPSEAAGLVRQRWPEAVVAPGRTDAVAVGPGLHERASAALHEALQDRVPVVVDADALAALRGPLPVPGVLTPHAGELGRMLGVPSGTVDAQPLAHARECARRFGAVVLLKGHRSLVVDPDGRVRVNPTGTSWLSAGGTGDVLTGAVAAFLARGLPPFEAASVAAYVHGRAGELAAAAAGVPTSSDVMAHLGLAIASVRR